MASLRVRKNVDNLTPDELKALRTGYAKAQQLMDNRGYNYFAGLHGVPNWFCWHHGAKQGSTANANLFLPWHRAYLLYFDRAIRDQSPATPKVGLPWWDWTSALSQSNGVPKAFSDATVSGAANPLFKARIFAPTSNPPINRFTRRTPGDPGDLPTKAQVDAVLNSSQFNDFSNQMEDIHDGVHGWTGGPNGDMGTLRTAAWDPIFWSHHCMIDRLWYVWQMKHGISNIPPGLLPMVLQPFGLTVKDVLSINALGYEYAVSFFTV